MRRRTRKGTTDKIDQDILWWNSLDVIWKEELISNLLQSRDYNDKGFSKNDIFEKIKESNQLITEIVNLKKLDISRKVLSDLSPIYYLKDIEEFHIFEPDWQDPDAKQVLELYPKYLRSKVKRLNLDGIPLGELTPKSDFSIFEDFINLEYLEIQSCHFGTLAGIEKLTKLKSLLGGMNNDFSDLNPLRGLPIKYLDLEWTQVRDISPLIDVPTLDYLNLNYLNDINDFSVLLHLPNLKTVIFTGWKEVKAIELKDYLMKNYSTNKYGRITISLSNKKVGNWNNHTLNLSGDESCDNLPF